MPSDEQLKQAVVESVQHGAYPDPDVSSAELPPSLLPALLADLQRVRDEVKTDIRQLSNHVAPDVDGWIAQAKRLQADIERSKATARDIVHQAEAGKALKEKTTDSSNKVRLLEKEVAFNEALATTLDQIRTATRILDTADLALANTDLRAALDAIRECDGAVGALSPVQDTRPVGLLQTRCSKFKIALLDRATELAHSLINCNSADRALVVNKQVSDTPTADISIVVETLTYVDGLDQYMKRLKRDLEDSLFEPRLSSHDGRAVSIQVDGDSIRASEGAHNPDTLATLDDIWTVLEFLSTRLPSSVCSPLSQKLLPSLFNRLTWSWLDACVPIQIEQMPVFQQILDRVTMLARQIDGLNWSSTAALKEWVQNAPRTWLSKRRETALGAARSLLFSGLRERKTVERVETQTVSKGDVIMGGTNDDGDEAWDEDWEEENSSSAGAGDAKKAFANQTAASLPEADDDEDASAWDMEDDNEPEQDKVPASQPDKGTGGDDEDAEAWGWGDEDPPAEEASELEPGTKVAQNKGDIPAQATDERELTLRETYTVTAVPDGILEIISQVVSDAETLTDPSYSGTPIGPAASALYTLPTFVLAIYRATASTAYGKLETGNMLVYNDASRLADQLHSFISKQTEKDVSSALPPTLRPSTRLRLDNDIKALESFAKRAYSAEMESQRTVVRDMLDGAQGFSNPTVEPFAGECESAVTITAERLREVHRQWTPILSRSALLQSLGSLLSTAVSKIIMDIEDLSDIGEEESAKLRSLCDRISEIKDVFVQEHAEGGASGDMTGIYCPNWFKFQYLGEILESSLADIKYLWTEGELRLEFDAEEVADLIQALFADSDYRRKAIAEIRRS